MLSFFNGLGLKTLLLLGLDPLGVRPSSREIIIYLPGLMVSIGNPRLLEHASIAGR